LRSKKKVLEREVILSKKKNHLYLILSGIFITNALLAELIGVKIFSLEKSLGFSPIGEDLIPGLRIEFALTAGVIIWPVVFITTDIINEYFGKRGVRKVTLSPLAWCSIPLLPSTS